MQLTLNIPDNIFFGINETEKSLTQILKQKLAIELYKWLSPTYRDPLNP